MPPSILRSRRKSQRREFLSQLCFYLLLPTFSNTDTSFPSEFSAATVVLPLMEHSQLEPYVRIAFVLLSMLLEVYVLPRLWAQNQKKPSYTIMYSN